MTFLRKMNIAPERGHIRNDLRIGVRVVGFERRATIAFSVSEDRVDILRIFRAGRDWKEEVSED